MKLCAAVPHCLRDGGRGMIRSLAPAAREGCVLVAVPGCARSEVKAGGGAALAFREGGVGSCLSVV